MEQDDRVLVAMRVADARLIAPGSAIGHCDVCGAEVYLSPSSQRTTIMRVWCVPCTRVMVAPGAARVSLAPGAADELRGPVERVRKRGEVR